ncbi:hypothetical protein BSKO_09670 [Bryopsis sp. KO-2023]|nr:hypothetical protein BSKO_09670 [Bryopsis sp. KO-2023]
MKRKVISLIVVTIGVATARRFFRRKRDAAPENDGINHMAARGLGDAPSRSRAISRLRLRKWLPKSICPANAFKTWAAFRWGQKFLMVLNSSQKVEEESANETEWTAKVEEKVDEDAIVVGINLSVSGNLAGDMHLLMRVLDQSKTAMLLPRFPPKNFNRISFSCWWTVNRQPPFLIFWKTAMLTTTSVGMGGGGG